jgi:hypothetical protein
MCEEQCIIGIAATDLEAVRHPTSFIQQGVQVFPHAYAAEKISSAIRILAIGEGDARSRLLSAFVEFQTLKTEDFPDELQSDYDWIIHELTKREPQGDVWSEIDQKWVPEALVPANLRRMINRTASRIAKKIVEIDYQLEVAYDLWKEEIKSNRNT